MTMAFPGPATSRLTNGVTHPHPVKGGRWYLPTRRPPRSRLKPGLDRSGTTACVAVRHEPSLINARPPAQALVMTASTVTVANIRPSGSTLPMTGDSASIWTVALKRLAPRTARLTVDWRSARSPENRPESGSAWTVSDPLTGTRNESLRTVRNPRTTYPISRISSLLSGDPAPPASGRRSAGPAGLPSRPLPGCTNASACGQANDRLAASGARHGQNPVPDGLRDLGDDPRAGNADRADAGDREGLAVRLGDRPGHRRVLDRKVRRRRGRLPRALARVGADARPGRDRHRRDPGRRLPDADLGRRGAELRHALVRLRHRPPAGRGDRGRDHRRPGHRRVLDPQVERRRGRVRRTLVRVAGLARPGRAVRDRDHRGVSRARRPRPAAARPATAS